jgi:hypothetical protein
VPYDSAFETRAFASAAEFDTWLAEHDQAPGLFLRIA